MVKGTLFLGPIVTFPIKIEYEIQPWQCSGYSVTPPNFFAKFSLCLNKITHNVSIVNRNLRINTGVNVNRRGLYPPVLDPYDTS